MILGFLVVGEILNKYNFGVMSGFKSVLVNFRRLWRILGVDYGDFGEVVEVWIDRDNCV